MLRSWSSLRSWKRGSSRNVVTASSMSRGVRSSRASRASSCAAGTSGGPTCHRGSVSDAAQRRFSCASISSVNAWRSALRIANAVCASSVRTASAARVWVMTIGSPSTPTGPRSGCAHGGSGSLRRRPVKPRTALAKNRRRSPASPTGCRVMASHEPVSAAGSCSSNTAPNTSASRTSSSTRTSAGAEAAWRTSAATFTAGSVSASSTTTNTRPPPLVTAAAANPIRPTAAPG